MTTARKIRPITAEDYLEGEMVGDIRHVSGAGEVVPMGDASERHNLIAGAFHFALFGHLRGSGCRVFAGTMKLGWSDDFFYSDVFVACECGDDAP